MLKEFKEFVVHGNVLDMAIGIIFGAAFKSIIDSLVADLITPIIGFALEGIDFRDWVLEVGNIRFGIGNFINTIISFLIIAFILFLIVKTTNRLRKEKVATTKICPFCKTEIDKDASRCPHCTSELN